MVIDNFRGIKMATLLNLLNQQLLDKSTEEQTERLDVELDTTQPSQPKLKLKQQSWAEGVGWFTQKTITLELEEAQTLLQNLEQAIIGGKIARSRPHSKESKLLETNNIIPFPVPHSR